jgi:hypothetical protein
VKSADIVLQVVESVFLAGDTDGLSIFAPIMRDL